MKRKQITSLVGSLLFLASHAVGGVVLAEQLEVPASSTAIENAARLTPNEVLRKIHLTNQLEIKAAQIGEERAQDRVVRDYAVQLVKDHARADRKVFAVASKEKIDLEQAIPLIDTPMTEKENVLLEKLRAVPEGRFDSTFLTEMESAHRDTVALLKQARPHVAGSRAARLIDQMLPTLAKHENMAQKIEKLAE